MTLMTSRLTSGQERDDGEKKKTKTKTTRREAMSQQMENRQNSAPKREEDGEKLQGRGDYKELIEKTGNESNPGDEKSANELSVKTEIPLVKVQRATPSPRPASQSEERTEKGKKLKKKKRKKEDGGDDDLGEEDEFDDEDEDEEDEEEEDVEEEAEEEDEDGEMTQDEKKAMYEAVVEGDIDLLEDCLDLPRADINMVWFQENLLMAAIRAGHVDVCEFLLDNGVDSTFSTSVVDLRDGPTGRVLERYEVDCRQMAYDRDLQDVVFLIDLLHDNLFPFIPRPLRTPRLRRPKLEALSDGTDSDDDADDENQDSSFSDVTDDVITSDLDQKGDVRSASGVAGSVTPEGESRKRNEEEKEKKKRKKRKKKSLASKHSRTNSAVDDEGLKEVSSDVNDESRMRRGRDEENDDDDDKDKSFRTDAADSGNYSMASSKLRKSLVRRHDKLYENEDKRASKSAKLDSARKSEGESTQSKSTNAAAMNDNKSQGRKSKGDKSDRTTTTTTTLSQEEEGEGQSTSERTTLETSTAAALSDNVVPEAIPKWAAMLMRPPKNQIRSNKAALAIRQGNLTGKFYKTPLHTSSLERPLQWRKVSTPGSYARESKRWHLETKIQEAGSVESVQISQLQLLPTFPQSQIYSSSPPSSRVTSITPTISTLGPKLPKKSNQWRSEESPSDALESVSSSSLSLSDRIDRFKSQKSNPKQDNASSSSGGSDNNNNNNGSSPTQSSTMPKVANYMRPTQSTITKNRLGTQFVDSYGGLDFQAVPAKSTSFRPGILKSYDKTTTINNNINTGRSKGHASNSSSLNFLSRSHKVPALAAKTVSQRRNHNVISYRV